MKKETYQEKLAKLLGLETVHQQVKEEEKTRVGNIQGVSEEKIQSFREAQGIIYFLQAPALFHSRTCLQCNIPFMVSRLNVAYCSYLCISESLAEIGIDWNPGEKEIEAKVTSAYEGNEPIWIRNLDSLRKALEVLSEAAESSVATT